MGMQEQPEALGLRVEEHVRYIQSLDTVCPQSATVVMPKAHTRTAERRTGVLDDRASTPQRRLLGTDSLASTVPTTSSAAKRDDRLCLLLSAS